jgi:hypothetical protein
VAALLTGVNSPAQEPAFYPSDYPSEGSPYAEGPAYGSGLWGPLASVGTAPGRHFGEFYVDYRIRRFGAAYTSYEFGDADPAGASPLSQLKFPLNSTWNGLGVGLEDPRWAVRAEWLTPSGGGIDGQLQDRDWLWQFAGLPPSPTPSDFGVAAQRWIDGQMADVALEIKLWESQGGVPVSVWPVGGFRWQKFEIMAYDFRQLKGFDSQSYQYVLLLPPPVTPGDVIRFRQEYYHYYLGGQLHIDLPPGALSPGARLTFQGDWADIQASNSDNHLLRQGNFITREHTDGDAWHIGVTGEIFFTDQFTVGVEGEYTQIRTSGSHHFVNQPLAIDQTWTRGVHVWSNQTAVTFFMRLRF